jgi:hypothetical protein
MLPTKQTDNQNPFYFVAGPIEVEVLSPTTPSRKISTVSLSGGDRETFPKKAKPVAEDNTELRGLMSKVEELADVPLGTPSNKKAAAETKPSVVVNEEDGVFVDIPTPRTKKVAEVEAWESDDDLPAGKLPHTLTYDPKCDFNVVNLLYPFRFNGT